MKKICLLCAAGMSTSMLVKKMQDAAKEMGYGCEITANPLDSAKTTCVDADIILLGPQVRFNLNRIKDLYPEKPVQAIDMATYGRMDGKKVLEDIKNILG